jgi:hypothetical protein
MKMFDEYSILHFASGIIAYFWGFPLLWWFIIHVVFEYIENTKMGMNFINTYIPLWPGGKHQKESFSNSMIGDNLSAVAGWMFASFIEKGFKFSLDRRNGNTKFKEMSSSSN